jgi:precorrin-2 dehydrogenase/sirohydrochlorin ferrochelatase
VIPLLHDFTGARVLVFGGGHVGARKARRFAREAQVVVVSPAFADADFGGGDLVRAAPGPDDVGPWLDRVAPALVVAATDDGDLNARVETEARERGVLVNRTDTHGGREAGSVVVPATVRDGDVVAAVSTGGASPALSRHLRERIEGELADAGAMAELTGELRDRLQREAVDPEDRRTAVREVVRNDRVWKLLGGAPAKARQTADAVVDRVVGEKP